MSLQGFINSEESNTIKLSTGNAELRYVDENVGMNKEIKIVNTDNGYLSLEGPGSFRYEIDTTNMPKIVGNICSRPVVVNLGTATKVYDGNDSFFNNLSTTFGPTASTNSGMIYGNDIMRFGYVVDTVQIRPISGAHIPEDFFKVGDSFSIVGPCEFSISNQLESKFEITDVESEVNDLISIDSNIFVKSFKKASCTITNSNTFYLCVCSHTSSDNSKLTLSLNSIENSALWIRPHNDDYRYSGKYEVIVNMSLQSINEIEENPAGITYVRSDLPYVGIDSELKFSSPSDIEELQNMTIEEISMTGDHGKNYNIQHINSNGKIFRRLLRMNLHPMSKTYDGDGRITVGFDSFENNIASDDISSSLNEFVFSTNNISAGDYSISNIFEANKLLSGQDCNKYNCYGLLNGTYSINKRGIEVKFKEIYWYDHKKSVRIYMNVSNRLSKDDVYVNYSNFKIDMEKTFGSEYSGYVTLSQLLSRGYYFEKIRKIENGVEVVYMKLNISSNLTPIIKNGDYLYIKEEFELTGKDKDNYYVINNNGDIQKTKFTFYEEH